MRCSVPDPGARGAPRRLVCSLCGAALAVGPAAEGGQGGEDPRDQLDTLRLDASSLATLVQLGETSRAAAGSELPSSRAAQASIPFDLASSRAAQASIPFDLAREHAVSLIAPRAPQATIPFELQPDAPVPLARQPLPSAPFVLRREVAAGAPGPASGWEQTFAARLRRPRRRWGLLALALLALVTLAALVASGRIDARRWIHWVTR